MKASGIVRKIDSLGRITLPKELRRKLDIKNQDQLEFFTEGDAIILAREEKAACVFCGSEENLSHYMDKGVCGKCLANLHGIGLAGKAM